MQSLSWAWLLRGALHPRLEAGPVAPPAGGMGWALDAGALDLREKGVG